MPAGSDAGGKKKSSVFSLGRSERSLH